jgi:Secretion system C-terminal sorting domain
MKKLLVIIASVFSSILCFSQEYWEEINIPEEFIAKEIRTIYCDTVENTLWLGGLIQHVDSIPGVPYNFLLKYDGINWENYGPFLGSNILAICRHQDKIVFGGSFQNYLGIYYDLYDQHRGIAYIRDDTVGHFEGMGVGLVYGLNVIDNELIAYGSFDTICGVAANFVAKYNGIQWNTLNDFPQIQVPGNAKLFCGDKYDGTYYLGGIFSNFDYFGGSGRCITNNIGLDWELSGGGVFGGIAQINTLKVYQNELYAGGAIFKGEGNAGNHIQKWDGLQWSSVGGDLTGPESNPNVWSPVFDLKVHNNELYLGGNFRYAGDILAKGVVKWDGEKYCSLGNDYNFGINSLTFYNDTLYVAGSHTIVDGYAPQIPILAKYIGGNTVVECSAVSIKENDALLQLDIYPSPATNEINIYLPKGNYKNLEVEVYNLLGQKLEYKNSTSLESKKINIQIQNFSKGQYTVLLKEKGVAMGSGRFIKE